MAYYEKQDAKKKRKPGFRAPDKSTDYRYAKTNRYTTVKQDRHIPGGRTSSDAPDNRPTRDFVPGDRPVTHGDKTRKGSFGSPAKPYGQMTAQGRQSSGTPDNRPTRNFVPGDRPAPLADRNRKSGFGRPAKPYGQMAPQGQPSGVPRPAFEPYGRPAAPPVAMPVPGPIMQPLVTEEDNNLLFGRNPIREALKAGRDIEKMLIAEGDLSGSAREIVAIARKAGINVQTVPKMQLDSITRNHQGMVAFASAYQYSSVDDILKEAKDKNEKPFIIILDQVTDPHNLGAVIRSAATMGVHGVIIPLHRAVGLTAVAVKTSSGGVEYVKVARVVNISRTIQDLKKLHIWVYAADMEGKDFRTIDFSGGAALVIGSEGEGISKLVKEQCDEVISIPTTGKIASLNASVAAGILMYGVYGSRNR